MALSSLQLEAFYALAQAGHFTRAAESLHVTQSALSQRILNLEADLATTLFIRDRLGVRLTHEGTELLRYCQAKEGLESEVLSRLRSKNAQALAGRVRIGGFSSILYSVIVPALVPLMQKNENVRLFAIERETYDLPGALQRGEVDFIVLDEKWEREGIKCVPLGHEQNVLVERKGYKGPDVYIDHDESDETTARYFRQRKQKWSGQRHFLDSVHGILEGVRNGLGKAVMPKHLLIDESLLKIIDADHVLKIPVYLHYYEQPYYSRLHAAVLSALQTLKI